MRDLPSTFLSRAILLLVVGWTIVLFFGMQARAAGSSPPTFNLDRGVAIDSVIGRNNLGRVNDALINLSNSGTEPIDIAINSPGGSVVSGFLFVNTLEAIRAKGIRLRCFVNGIAASMAFQILTHCDERYSLSRSFLLWHRVRTSLQGPITAPLAELLVSDLQSIDDVIIRELKESVGKGGMDDEVLLKHFERETLHIGENLARSVPGFMQSYASLPNLIEAFTDKRVVRSSEASGLFGLGDFAPGEIVYIYGR